MAQVKSAYKEYPVAALLFIEDDHADELHCVPIFFKDGKMDPIHEIKDRKYTIVQAPVGTIVRVFNEGHDFEIKYAPSLRPLHSK